MEYMYKNISYRKAEANELNMSSLRGQINTTYDELVETFGEPHITGNLGDKIDFEWCFVFEDDEENPVVASIYNWKSGVCYNGVHGLATEDIKVWNVGGFRSEAVDYLQGAIDAKKEGK